MMDEKTEIVKEEPIKKKKGRKKKLNLGIYKYFIAIGGTLIVAMIFISIWISNSRGGLVKMSMDEYLNDTKKIEERTVVYIGSNDNISAELTDVLQEITKKQRKQYYYFDVTNIKSVEDTQKIQNRFVATQTGYVVPMVLVLEDGEIVDERPDKSIGIPSGMMQGYLDRDTLIQFLKDNKVY